MAFKALTVNTPVEEPAHILAEDDATLYDTIIGSDCVLPVGGQLNASIISNNSIRITDGMVIVGGHVGRIIKGDYEDMAIANGVSGQNRNDLIVARFISGGTGGADTYSLVVVQGTPGDSATDPAIVQGDLYAGEEQRDYPLWRVKIEGLSVVGLEKMYTVGTMLSGKVNIADVIDNLTSSDVNKPLSANQGKIINTIKLNIANVINNLLTTKSGYALDARQGKVLSDRMGPLESLVTGVKTSLVNAINWLKSQLDTTNSNVTNLNNKLKDSGWVACGMGNGLSAAEGQAPSVRKIGNVVYLRGSITAGTSWSEHDSFLTIPSGYRPAVPARFIQWAYGTYRYTLSVEPSGVCIANHVTNDQNGDFKIPSGSTLRINCSWMIN